MHPKDKLLLTLDELAMWLGLRPGAVKTLIGQNIFPEAIRVGSEPRWLSSDVVEFLERMAYERAFEPAVFTGKPKEVVVVKNTKDAPSPLEPFKADLLEECNQPAVYFLVLQNVVVYVGLSVNPRRRIRDHTDGTPTTPQKEFDNAFFLMFPLTELLEKEKYFIHLFDPPLNVKCKPK